MSSRGCGIGCLTLVGALFLGVAVDLLFQAEFGATVFCLALGGLPLFYAWSLWRQGLAEQQRQTDLTAEEQQARAAMVEHQILTVAARRDGVVTPAILAMEVAHLTVATAKAKLDELEAAGYCHSELDDHNALVYRFELGLDSDRELSAAEWVAEESQRMTGRHSDQSQSNLL